jgi:hypothetical protein
VPQNKEKKSIQLTVPFEGPGFDALHHNGSTRVGQTSPQTQLAMERWSTVADFLQFFVNPTGLDLVLVGLGFETWG